MRFLELILITTFLFISSVGFSQFTEGSDRNIRDGIYVVEGFGRYKGNIELLGDTAIKYDHVTVRIYTRLQAGLRTMLEKGIFYPSIIDGNLSGGSWEKFPPETGSKLLIDITQLSIGDFDEEKLTGEQFTRKRFRFWLFFKGIHNPSEYIIELENKQATQNTHPEIFMKDARLTYVKFVTIII